MVVEVHHQELCEAQVFLHEESRHEIFPLHDQSILYHFYRSICICGKISATTCMIIQELYLFHLNQLSIIRIFQTVLCIG